MLIKAFEYEGLDLDPKNLLKDTPLVLALENSQFKAAELFIEMGADIKVIGRNCMTPLMIATEKGLTSTAKMIATADPRTVLDKNILGETSIQIAERLKNEALVGFFLGVGSRVTTPSGGMGSISGNGGNKVGGVGVICNVSNVSGGNVTNLISSKGGKKK